MDPKISKWYLLTFVLPSILSNKHIWEVPKGKGEHSICVFSNIPGNVERIIPGLSICKIGCEMYETCINLLKPYKIQLWYISDCIGLIHNGDHCGKGLGWEHDRLP